MVASLFLAIDVIGGSTEKPGSRAGPGTQTHSSTLDSHLLTLSRPNVLSYRSGKLQLPVMLGFVN